MFYSHRNAQVVSQFQKSWRHPPSEKPRFKRVVRIIGLRPPRAIQDRFNRYKYSLVCLFLSTANSIVIGMLRSVVVNSLLGEWLEETNAEDGTEPLTVNAS